MLYSFDVLDIPYSINDRFLRKRKRRTDVVVVRGRLRLYSASGFFLLLGLVILAIGIGMATLGYWPQSEVMHPAKTGTGGRPDPSNGTAADATAANGSAANASAFNNVQGESSSPTASPRTRDKNNAKWLRLVLPATPSKQTGGALARFLEQHRHSERMKMLGPFTMGIGIFIFICANAILHENRDRETKVSLLSALHCRGVEGRVYAKIHLHCHCNILSPQASVLLKLQMVI